jgi:acrylyl-CoA reductase (NADPH)
VLVSGATGGVGSFAVALAAARGYEVVALTGKPDAAAYLEGLGAREMLDRRSLELPGRPLGKARWGGAIDTLGGDILAWIASTTVPNGSIACIGLAASPKLETTVLPLILRGVSLLGVDSVHLPPERRARLWRELATIGPRPLAALVTAEVGLDEVPAISRAMLAGQHSGRTLVRIDA